MDTLVADAIDLDNFLHLFLWGFFLFGIYFLALFIHSIRSAYRARENGVRPRKVPSRRNIFYQRKEKSWQIMETGDRLREQNILEKLSLLIGVDVAGCF